MNIRNGDLTNANIVYFPRLSAVVHISDIRTQGQLFAEQGPFWYTAARLPDEMSPKECCDRSWNELST